MLLFPPSEFRKRAGRPKRKAPPVALTRVAAYYEPATLVRLTFDRAIDVSSVDGNAILVFDGASENERFKVDAPGELVGPATVEFSLIALGAWAGPADVRLDATAATGIVAAEDGGTWSGVTGLVLPFP